MTIRSLPRLRDDHLWKESGADSWDQYLKKNAVALCGKSYNWSTQLIAAGEVQKKLPFTLVDQSEFSASHLVELSRLAPTVDKPNSPGKSKDFRKLKKQDVSRVIKSAEAIANGKPVSVSDVRKAVDADLGIDRSKKAAGR